ncbi:MAG: M1 family peptidase [Bacteroidia bacterium]|nr:M1 family peptidase [Bacteroidia bacterium]
MNKLILPFLLAFVAAAYGQAYDPLHPPNTYQSSANPNYWKNKMPFPGYWQQDTYYQIKANIDEQTDIISATQQLTYTNNSPDTLHFVFFHLYQNAFQPGSYSDALHHANKVKPTYGKYEEQLLNTVVEKMQCNGNDLKTELDNTILRVWLDKPLLPNTSVTFDIAFKTYFDSGTVRRRMKTFDAYGNKHYDGVHWYPRICVYDRKFGWETDQHLGKEFYGDFGAYDVELTFADNYVMEATGYLLNREEVLPDELRQKLDIKNFAKKPWDEAPSIITPYDPSKRKTWKFHAENVHDFAFTADPTYRIGEEEWNGIQIISLAQEPHASGWQNAASYTAKVVEVYSRDFGMYVYNKMVVADARDGMEYPMITLDGGSDPGYRGLLAHEVGHNWFFGQVGNNETYRAALDEGFTQFLTVWAEEHIDGKGGQAPEKPKNYQQRYYKPLEKRLGSAYYGYLRDAIRGDETTLNTHSDDFDGALRHGGGYGQVYYKTAAMLFNLQYVLGDELFLNAMKHYFNQWKIAHPYVEDFRNSIIQYTKVDLNWFFDQWLETAKTIDYSVRCVKKKKDGQFEIHFRRNGEMQMPIDFSVFDKAGKRHDFYIPNNWFEKKTDATILPRWIGWGKLKNDYTANVKITAGIEKIVIDTSYRLADINMLNNSRKKPVDLRFDSRVSSPSDWRNYELFARPDLWYNFFDGVKFGFNINGNYMNYRHIFDFTVWLNSGLGKVREGFTDVYNAYNPFSVKGSYQTATDKILKGSSVNISGRYLDGLIAAQVGFEVKSRKGGSVFYTYLKSLYRADSSDLSYLIYRNDWAADRWNATINLGIRHTYTYRKGSGQINLHLRSTTVGSDYDYSQVWLTAINRNKLGKLSLNTRFIAQWGAGNYLAPESALFLAGANPEAMVDNKFTRSRAFFPQELTCFGNDINHFHAGGGLNLRGYSGYYVPHLRADGAIVSAYSGNSGAAFNAELEFDRLFPIKPRFLKNWLKVNTYLFGDIGTINVNMPGEALAFSEIRADAGLGIAFTIKKWGPLSKEAPLTLRFDMPLWLNRTPAVSPDFLQFRWLVGVNRAF